MKKIITKDESITFHNEEVDETYHSISGAKEEAIEKFVKPCELPSLALREEIVLLDICFGLGYNSAAAIDAIWKENPNCHITIIALENDQRIIDQIEPLNAPFDNYALIKEVARTQLVDKDNIKIKLIMKDALASIKDINQQVDAVFLDPFSPKKCPELWTKEFFKDIAKIMKPGARLATYSCARVVRENLKEVGLVVEDGPSIGRRAPSTVAIKQ